MTVHCAGLSVANYNFGFPSEISRIENRTDVYVSTLASYVEAMGGRLEIRAVFPDGGAVKINPFRELTAKAAD